MLASLYPHSLEDGPASQIFTAKAAKSGMLKKKAGGMKFLFQNKYDKRLIVIYKGWVYYFKDEKSDRPQGKFSLEGYSSNVVVAEEEETKVPHVFKLFSKKKDERVWYFAADNELEKKEWMNAFREEIERYNIKIENPTSHSTSCPNPDHKSPKEAKVKNHSFTEGMMPQTEHIPLIRSPDSGIAKSMQVQSGENSESTDIFQGQQSNFSIHSSPGKNSTMGHNSGCQHLSHRSFQDHIPYDLPDLPPPYPPGQKPVSESMAAGGASSQFPNMSRLFYSLQSASAITKCPETFTSCGKNNDSLPCHSLRAMISQCDNDMFVEDFEKGTNYCSMTEKRDDKEYPITEESSAVEPRVNFQVLPLPCPESSHICTKFSQETVLRSSQSNSEEYINRNSASSPSIGQHTANSTATALPSKVDVIPVKSHLFKPQWTRNMIPYNISPQNSSWTKNQYPNLSNPDSVGVQNHPIPSSKSSYPSNVKNPPLPLHKPTTRLNANDKQSLMKSDRLSSPDSVSSVMAASNFKFLPLKTTEKTLTSDNPIPFLKPIIPSKPSVLPRINKRCHTANNQSSLSPVETNLDQLGGVAAITKRFNQM